MSPYAAAAFGGHIEFVEIKKQRLGISTPARIRKTEGHNFPINRSTPSTATAFPLQSAELPSSRIDRTGREAGFSGRCVREPQKGCLHKS